MGFNSVFKGLKVEEIRKAAKRQSHKSWPLTRNGQVWNSGLYASEQRMKLAERDLFIYGVSKKLGHTWGASSPTQKQGRIFVNPKM